MIYNKKRYKELVRRSLDFQNQGTHIYNENREEYSELSKYNIAVEEQVFWAHREKFVVIMKNFLDNSNNFDEFETTFSLLYEEVKKEVNMLITDLEQIDKFQPSTKSYQFASTLGLIYHQFESVEDEYCT